jgi:SNF2 family DNA or RNA helicase
MNNDNGVTSIEQFIDSLISEKGFAHADPAVIEQMKKDLRSELSNQIDRTVIDMFSSEQAKAFAELCENPNSTADQIQKFVADSGVDTKRAVVNTMVKFREYYLGAAA